MDADVLKLKRRIERMLKADAEPENPDSVTLMARDSTATGILESVQSGVEMLIAREYDYVIVSGLTQQGALFASDVIGSIKGLRVMSSDEATVTFCVDR